MPNGEILRRQNTANPSTSSPSRIPLSSREILRRQKVALLLSSTPEFGNTFDSRLDPIGSGYRRRKTFPIEFSDMSHVDFKIELARASKSKGSKFAKFFPPRELQAEVGAVQVVEGDLYSRTAIETNSNDSKTSPSPRVSFDLGAQSASGPSDVKRAECRARACVSVRDEAVLAGMMRLHIIHELLGDAEISFLTCQNTVNNILNTSDRDLPDVAPRKRLSGWMRMYKAWLDLIRRWRPKHA